jgi:hypothetical protein
MVSPCVACDGVKDFLDLLVGSIVEEEAIVVNCSKLAQFYGGWWGTSWNLPALNLLKPFSMVSIDSSRRNMIET